MKTITIEEYKAELADLATQISQRFEKQIRVDVENASLWLRTETCHGHVGLAFTSGKSSMISKAEFSRGSALSGPIDEVMRGLCEYQIVHDALVLAVLRFANTEITG